MNWSWRGTEEDVVSVAQHDGDLEGAADGLSWSLARHDGEADGRSTDGWGCWRLDGGGLGCRLRRCGWRWVSGSGVRSGNVVGRWSSRCSLLVELLDHCAGGVSGAGGCDRGARPDCVDGLGVTAVDRGVASQLNGLAGAGVDGTDVGAGEDGLTHDVRNDDEDDLGLVLDLVAGGEKVLEEGQLAYAGVPLMFSASFFVMMPARRLGSPSLRVIICSEVR